MELQLAFQTAAGTRTNLLHDREHGADPSLHSRQGIDTQLLSCEPVCFWPRNSACFEAGTHHIIQLHAILEAERIKLFVRCRNTGIVLDATAGDYAFCGPAGEATHCIPAQAA